MKKQNLPGTLASIITYIILSSIYGLSLGLFKNAISRLAQEIIIGNFVILIISGSVFTYITKEKITTYAGFVGFMIMLVQYIISIIYIYKDFSIIVLSISLVTGYAGYSLGSVIVKLFYKKI